MSKERTEMMSFRLTPVEKENLSNKAAEAHLSMSQYLIKLSEQKKIIVADELPELIRQIVKIGTNVNQIALVANTHKSVSSSQIQLLDNDLNEVQRLLRKLIDSIKGSDDDSIVTDRKTSSQELEAIKLNQILMQQSINKIMAAVGIADNETEG